MATNSAQMIWELVRLNPSASIELFQLDLTPLGDKVYRWFNGTNHSDERLYWQGEAYDALPIKAEGYAMSLEGSPPRPKLTISNPLNIIGQMLATYDDIMGMRVTRICTRAKFLDARNFPQGNADASSFELPRDIYYVKRKSSHNREVIELELGAATDLITQFPSRMVTVTSCTAQYRCTETCGYQSHPLTDNLGRIFNYLHDDFLPKGEWQADIKYDTNNYVFIRQFPIGVSPDPDANIDMSDPLAVLPGESRKVFFVCLDGEASLGQNPLSSPEVWRGDACTKQVEYPGCKYHFPVGPLPFNGFPGAAKIETV